MTLPYYKLRFWPFLQTWTHRIGCGMLILDFVLVDFLKSSLVGHHSSVITNRDGWSARRRSTVLILTNTIFYFFQYIFYCVLSPNVTCGTRDNSELSYSSTHFTMLSSSLLLFYLFIYVCVFGLLNYDLLHSCTCRLIMNIYI